MSGLTKEEARTEMAACHLKRCKDGLDVNGDISRGYMAGWLACAESQADRLRTADEYIATLESQAVAVSISATVIRMEKKAAYLKARDAK